MNPVISSSQSQTTPPVPHPPTIPHAFGETTQTWDCLGTLLTVEVTWWAAAEAGTEWLPPGSRWSSRQRGPPAGSHWSRRTPTCGNLDLDDMDRGENTDGTSDDIVNLNTELKPSPHAHRICANTTTHTPVAYVCRTMLLNLRLHCSETFESHPAFYITTLRSIVQITEHLWKKT